MLDQKAFSAMARQAKTGSSKTAIKGARQVNRGHLWYMLLEGTVVHLA